MVAVEQVIMEEMEEMVILAAVEAVLPGIRLVFEEEVADLELSLSKLSNILKLSIFYKHFMLYCTYG